MCLYLCFENTGTVSLIPNGGDINMIPIKDPSVVINAPTTTMKDEEIFGGGFFDKIKKVWVLQITSWSQTGVISKYAKYIPQYGEQISKVASSLGYGIPGYRDSGGALNYSGGALNICGDSACQVLYLQVSIKLINKQSEKTPCRGEKKLFLIQFNFISIFYFFFGGQSLWLQS